MKPRTKVVLLPGRRVLNEPEKTASRMALEKARLLSQREGQPAARHVPFMWQPNAKINWIHLFLLLNHDPPPGPRHTWEGSRTTAGAGREGLRVEKHPSSNRRACESISPGLLARADSPPRRPCVFQGDAVGLATTCCDAVQPPPARPERQSGER